MASRKTLRIKMIIPKGIVGKPIMHTLGEKFHLVHNTILGRITVKGAWLDVEVSGNAGNIDKALAYLGELGVAVEKVD